MWWHSTFAISLQLFPSSRIFFNRSSSAGVHGVFVLPFFGGGPATGGSVVGPADSEVTAKVDGPGGGAGAGAIGLGVIC
jgi:hypothetical protein